MIERFSGDHRVVSVSSAPRDLPADARARSRDIVRLYTATAIATLAVKSLSFQEEVILLVNVRTECGAK